MAEITLSKYIEKIMSDAYGELLGPSILKEQCKNLNIDFEEIKVRDLKRIADRIFEVTKSFGEEKAREVKLRIINAKKIVEKSYGKQEWRNDERDGDTQVDLKEYSIAIGYYKKTIGELDLEKNLSDYARICKKIGSAFNRLEDYKQSILYYDNAIEAYKKLEDYSGLASSLNGKASSVWRLGEHEEALKIAENALKATERMPFGSRNEKKAKSIMMAGIYTTIGNIYLDLADKEKAVDYCNKAIDIYEELEMLGRAGGVYNNLARVYEDFGDFEQASKYYKKGVDLCKESGNIFMEGWTRFNLASVYAELGKPELAIEECDKSMRIMSSFNNRLGKSRVECMRGKAYKVMKEFEKATEHFERSLKLLRGIQAVDYIEITLYEFARMYADKGEREKAIEKLKEAVETHKDRPETITSKKIKGLLEKLQS